MRLHWLQLTFLATSLSLTAACDEEGKGGGEGEGEGEGEVDCPDGDDDGDGVCNGDDVCVGDDATGDSDGDAVCDDLDLCNGDDATGDSDGDAVCDDLDICVGDDASGDTDGDLTCNDSDDDDDDDGCLDGEDADPLVASVDEDGDGSPQDCDPCFGNDAFGDADGDGVCDRASDTDGDGCLNAIDSDNTTAGTDSDSDGFADECDFCPSDATSACAAWMVSRSAPYLYYFDTTTLEAQYEVALTESTGTITIEGLNGLAVDPVTSTPYVVAKALSSRHLASLDLSTASLTVIGDLGDNVSDIAFDAAGTLYAVTGDGADIPNELYTVDLATGAMTSFATLGNGNDGEALAYCPDDGLMYHLSGTGSTMVFESIDLSTSTVTSLGRDYDTSEAISFHWDDSMSAFLINFRSGNGSYLDTTGVDSELGTWSGGGVVTSGITDYRYKGMVIVQ